MSSIAGRVILVTGASTGIGAACVDKLIASDFLYSVPYVQRQMLSDYKYAMGVISRL
jgi:NAD(P)-dependent dehydrogenase (short-subunit alcohol dehydrogenase family)